MKRFMRIILPKKLRGNTEGGKSPKRSADRADTDSFAGYKAAVAAGVFHIETLRKYSAVPEMGFGMFASRMYDCACDAHRQSFLRKTDARKMPDAHLSPVHGCENGMEQYPHREKII